MDKRLIKLEYEHKSEKKKLNEQYTLLAEKSDTEKYEIKHLLENMQRKFDKQKQLLEEKVMHYCERVDEEQTLNKEHVEREEQLKQRYSQLEEELKHSKLSKKVTDTIEKHEITNRKLRTIDEISRTDKSPYQDERRETRNTPGEPSPPKLSYYDGKSEWKPYYMQFIHFANRYKWDSKQRLDKLLACLKDKALKFYSTRPISTQNDFVLLSEKMNQRFGKKDLPYTIRRQLSEVKPNLDESVEEFAEKVQEMASDGYGPTTPENVIETISVDAFLKGCNDKRAALFAMEKIQSHLIMLYSV